MQLYCVSSECVRCTSSRCHVSALQICQEQTSDWETGRQSGTETETGNGTLLRRAASCIANRKSQLAGAKSAIDVG